MCTRETHTRSPVERVFIIHSNHCRFPAYARAGVRVSSSYDWRFGVRAFERERTRVHFLPFTHRSACYYHRYYYCYSYAFGCYDFNRRSSRGSARVHVRSCAIRNTLPFARLRWTFRPSRKPGTFPKLQHVDGILEKKKIDSKRARGILLLYGFARPLARRTSFARGSCNSTASAWRAFRARKSSCFTSSRKCQIYLILKTDF